MKRKIVDSSMIRSIGYYRDEAVLEIEFNSGALWQYEDFPMDAWKDFQNSSSKGRFFNDQIRDEYAEYQIKRR